jgi:hypothetical protein
VWTDSWPSIAGVGCGLIGVGSGEEQARMVYASGAPSVEKIIRLRSRDPVASGIKCGPHDDKNSKMRLCTVSWLSLKTKVEPGRRGGQVTSGD